MSEDESREQFEEIMNNNEEPAKKEEPVKEAVCGTIIEEEDKPKPKAKQAKPKAKPNNKITKQPVEEPVEPIVETVEEKPEPPKNIYKLKEIVKCPGCNMDMTVPTLKYIHKRRSFCKADTNASPEPEKTPEPVVQQKPKITQDIVNDYIKENPNIVSNYLRNERAMEAQRKQMNARPLLNNAFIILFFILYIIKDAV